MTRQKPTIVDDLSKALHRDVAVSSDHTFERRRVLSGLQSILCVVAVVTTAACTQRGTLGAITPSAHTVAATDIAILFATDRSRIKGTDLFGAARSPETTFGRLDVEIPLERSLGTITYPDTAAPERPAFHVLNGVLFEDNAGSRDALNQRLAHNPAGQTIVVFVHGYNTNFAEAVYLHAQMTVDLGMPQTAVLYAWPSEGTASGYVYDISSVLFARDRFEQVLNTIAGSDATDIIVVAHSMGALLALETVRQAALRPRSPVLGKLRGMFLIAPDVGVDLFNAQRQVIDPQTIPICVIASDSDRALGLSAWLHGNEPRLGQLTRPNAVARLTAAVIDVSQFSNPASDNHLTVAQSTELIGLIRDHRSGELAACATPGAQGTVDHVALK
ncbi:alpha/beta hydrolase [Yoonia vestfoldensis]|uniref:alpha/beta hydrolase n=1 Tax=Yoonia vestfoldensis TaxID=245188 RepID=UPI001B7F9893|nr:alpha/beta fold hydrolase [Yoonia vestfoldensis]